jgi:hypothetical protein
MTRVSDEAWESLLQMRRTSMTLVVPYIGVLRNMDARVVRLAEFLGLRCETVSLASIAEHSVFLEERPPDHSSCFLVNPRVLHEWIGPNGALADLIALLLSRFSKLLVCGLGLDAFSSEIVAAVSHGRLKTVDAVDEGRAVYEVARDSKDICGAFAGLSFGLSDPENDHVFCSVEDDSDVRPLISIGGRPFMVTITIEDSEVLLIASEEVADIDSEIGDAPLSDYFSRLVPHAMALRHIFAASDLCWRPSRPYASIIIDDPLLRETYGFLDFECLLGLAEQNQFHTAIAFIPHNYRRNSSHITRMFLEHRERLSICYHGNDHTAAEFATADRCLLDTLLRSAKERMDLHCQTTGLFCDKVMVFPQGKFSIEAMKALREHNFDAAVNTVPHPAGEPVRLTIRELAQPAVLRFGGFPLFLRRPIQKLADQDIAFDLFFGRPVLVVEHHQIFEHPEALSEIATRINSLAPEVRWCSLGNVARNSILVRRTDDGTCCVRAYSSTIELANHSTTTRRYLIEWNGPFDSTADRVVTNGTPCDCVEIVGSAIRIFAELAPGVSKRFGLVHQHACEGPTKLGLRWHARAFVRRRLSEVRDNYLSRNRWGLMVAKTLQQRFMRA